MPGPKPNRLHDELDALLDARPVELTHELAPLAEAADALRTELAAIRLDPEAANRHLERVLDGSATVVRLPAGAQRNGRNLRLPSPNGWTPRLPQPHGWDLRRRAAAVVLAAALVLAPATIASAAALPGQAMYPFKRAIEELRIASVQWSPSREASERTRVADERLEEVQTLMRLEMFSQLPGAIDALKDAVVDAQAAVTQAQREGEPVSSAVADLIKVRLLGGQVVQQVVAAAQNALAVPAATREAMQAAAVASQGVLPMPAKDPMTGGPGAAPGPVTSAPAAETESTVPPPTVPPPTAPPPTAPPVTDPPTTIPPTTSPPTTSPPTTVETATTASAGGGQDGGGDQSGAGVVPGEATPTTIG